MLDIPLLDTRQGHDLTGQLITNIVLQLLSYVAGQYIRQRQAEGIRDARKRGTHLGRKQIIMPPGFQELADAWQHGYIPNDCSRFCF